MICKNCGRDNRPEASYCRFCGEAIVQESTQKGLIAKDAIAPLLDDLDKNLQVAKIVTKDGARIKLDCLVLGDSGTGKCFVAELIAQKMLASGVVKQPAKKVDAAEWDVFASDFDKKLAALKDGILIITNAQKLLPTTKAQEVNQLDKLFHYMRNEKGVPIVILCGDNNDLASFLDNNKDVYRLFKFDFRLPAFRIFDLTELTLQLLQDKYQADAADELPKKLNAHFAWCMRQKDLGYVNGHLAEEEAQNLYVKAMLRNSKTIEAGDVDTSECFIPKTEEEILAELDN